MNLEVDDCFGTTSITESSNLEAAVGWVLSTDCQINKGEMRLHFCICNINLMVKNFVYLNEKSFT